MRRVEKHARVGVDSRFHQANHRPAVAEVLLLLQADDRRAQPVVAWGPAASIAVLLDPVGEFVGVRVERRAVGLKAVADIDCRVGRDARVSQGTIFSRGVEPGPKVAEAVRLGRRRGFDSRQNVGRMGETGEANGGQRITPSLFIFAPDRSTLDCRRSLRRRLPYRQSFIALATRYIQRYLTSNREIAQPTDSLSAAPVKLTKPTVASRTVLFIAAADIERLRKSHDSVRPRAWRGLLSVRKRKPTTAG